MRDAAVVHAARKLIDAPYALGNPGSGWDCLTMVWEFFDNVDIHLPREFKGYSAENYAERWKAGEGRDELREYLFGLGEPVEPNYERAGDLLIFDAEKWVFPGIYLGSGHVLCCFEKGCMVVPFRLFKHVFINGRRLLLNEE